MSTEWTWNDGWILMSLYLVAKEGGAKLSEIIGAADATNHAIPTTRELTSAFSKLTQFGVVKIEENRFQIEDSYLEGLEKAQNSRGGLFESADKGVKWLKKENLSHMNSEIIEITDGQMSQACNEYKRKLRK